MEKRIGPKTEMNLDGLSIELDKVYISQSKIKQKIIQTLVWKEHVKNCSSGDLKSFNIADKETKLEDNKDFVRNLSFRMQFEKQARMSLVDKRVMSHDELIEKTMKKDRLEFSPKLLYGSDVVSVSCSCGKCFSLESSGHEVFSDDKIHLGFGE